MNDEVKIGNNSYTEEQINNAIYETLMFQMAVQSRKVNWDYPIADVCQFSQKVLAKLRGVEGG